MSNVTESCPFCQSRRVVVTGSTVDFRELKCEECSHHWLDTTDAPAAVKGAESRPARWSSP
jgi:transposase-like protein